MVMHVECPNRMTVFSKTFMQVSFCSCAQPVRDDIVTSSPIGWAHTQNDLCPMAHLWWVVMWVQVLICVQEWNSVVSGWRHQMETFSALLAMCAGNSPHKGQWCGALMFSLICVWINGWVNNREAGDLRRYRAHYDVIVMMSFPNRNDWSWWRHLGRRALSALLQVIRDYFVFTPSQWEATLQCNVVAHWPVRCQSITWNNDVSKCKKNHFVQASMCLRSTHILSFGQPNFSRDFNSILSVNRVC